MSDSPEFIIVIGAPRSGTKFLRDLLASSCECRKVPYDVNHVWFTGNRIHADDVLNASDCRPKIALAISRKLQKLSGWRCSAPARYVVEKTVSNCLRIPFVEQALPSVRYVHLVRDGRDVVESSLRQWTSRHPLRYMIGKLRYVPLTDSRYLLWYAGNLLRGRIAGRRGVRVWGARYPGVEDDVQHANLLEVCSRQWSECVTGARRDLAVIDAERTIEIRYENLIRDSNEVVRLCRFLELPDVSHVLAHYQSYLAPASPGKWKQWLGDPHWDRAMEILAPQLWSLGYLQSATTHSRLAA